MVNYNIEKSAIFALSSGIGKSGIAVFRISGNYDVILNVISSMTNLDINKVISQPRYAFFTRIFDSKTKGQLDDALVIFFPAPFSFTGDNVLEIQSHGGPAIIQSVLKSLSNIAGLRLAEKGEFTKQAFFNGKMDLLQVEGISDLIDAETEQSRKLALKQVSGDFSLKMKNIKDKLVYLLSMITAEIDFLSDEFSSSINQTQTEVINGINNVLSDLVKFSNNNIGEIIRSGFFVTILGSPNVGKSSLFNAIIGQEKSIISSIPGTTRDVVDVKIDIDGISVELSDTAGLRETSDIVENEGIKKALKCAENADLKMLVLDISSDLPINIDDNTVVIVNKIDLDKEIDKTKYPKNTLFVSAKTGQGIEQLKNCLSEKIQGKISNNSIEDIMITQERHRQAIQNMITYLKETLKLSKIENSLDLQAENIKLALNEIEYLTGKIYFNDLLDNIFSKFCIGK